MNKKYMMMTIRFHRSFGDEMISMIGCEDGIFVSTLVSRYKEYTEYT